MSAYRYISIGARIAPLDAIVTPEYAATVHREVTLAESAPELLAALRALRTALYGVNMNDDARRFDSEIAWADEAIAKAEGRA